MCVALGAAIVPALWWPVFKIRWNTSWLPSFAFLWHRSTQIWFWRMRLQLSFRSCLLDEFSYLCLATILDICMDEDCAPTTSAKSKVFSVWRASPQSKQNTWIIRARKQEKRSSCLLALRGASQCLYIYIVRKPTRLLGCACYSWESLPAYLYPRPTAWLKQLTARTCFRYRLALRENHAWESLFANRTNGHAPWCLARYRGGGTIISLYCLP